MTNNESTKQPMLPDTGTCLADQKDLLKVLVIDYVRKTDEKSVPISSDRAMPSTPRDS